MSDIDEESEDEVRGRGRIVYVEREKQDWRTWVLAIVAVVAGSGVGAAWGLQGRVSALEATAVADNKRIEAHDRQLERILNILEGRSGTLRGGPDESHAR